MKLLKLFSCISVFVSSLLVLSTSAHAVPAIATTTYSCPNGANASGSGATTICSTTSTNTVAPVANTPPVTYSCPTGFDLLVPQEQQELLLLVELVLVLAQLPKLLLLI